MKMTKFVAVMGIISSTLMMTACATPNGYITGSPNAALNGAIAGAAVGALAKSDGNRKDIGKGAVIGAATGAATGYVLSTSPNYPYQR